jgi:putative transcriptional regulator
VAMVVLIFNDCIKTKEAQGMLNENIRNLRKSKGLSQEELAIRLNVVRQTISKWEKGLSVPDSSMIISLAEELDTSVSTLLGETVQEECLDKENMKSI